MFMATVCMMKMISNDHEIERGTNLTYYSTAKYSCWVLILEKRKYSYVPVVSHSHCISYPENCLKLPSKSEGAKGTFYLHIFLNAVQCTPVLAGSSCALGCWRDSGDSHKYNSTGGAFSRAEGLTSDIREKQAKQWQIHLLLRHKQQNVHGYGMYHENDFKWS
jgi:hypothetical protein